MLILFMMMMITDNDDGDVDCKDKIYQMAYK